MEIGLFAPTANPFASPDWLHALGSEAEARGYRSIWVPEHVVLFEDYSGGVAEIKAQVESGNIQWDVVDFEVIDLERACSEGLLETIDHSVLPAGIDGTPAAQDFIA